MCYSFLAATLVVTALSQAPHDAQAEKAAREEKLRFLREKAAGLKLYRQSNSNSPVPLMDRAVLNYNNPVGLSGDGATFLWRIGERPVAVVSFSIRRPNNAVYRECASLWAEPLDCRENGATLWAPKQGGLLAQKFADAPVPGSSQSRRMTQMRELARRFSVTWFHSRTDEQTQLSLLPQPLYRMETASDGILDGALFAFTVTNDPEMLLLIEAARDKAGDEPYWRYSLARMSSLREAVRLDDKEIWTVPHYHSDPNDDKKTGHYTEQRVGTFVPQNAAP
jgi:hypothetical protein